MEDRIIYDENGFIEQVLDKPTSEELTADLKKRLDENVPYPENSGYTLLPFEPMVKVQNIKTYHQEDGTDIELTNHRAIQQTDGTWVIPVAIYSKNGQRGLYTQFEECKVWSEVYGIDNLVVDVLAIHTNNSNILIDN